MDWFHIVMAAFQTVCTLAPSVLPMFHGGAAKTADKVGSALTVVHAFVNGTAAQLTAADVHPELAAHAQLLSQQQTTVLQTPKS